MTYAKRKTFSRWCPLLAVLMLMLARASASLAAAPQESSGAQAPSAAEPASGSVVPRVIQFSGTVKDAEGKLATGPVELTFSLYQFEEGGRPLWVETQTVQLDSQGHYTVLLGAASSAGLPLDVFTSGSARWLGVQPALPGVGEQPRVLLVGVPYALKAADAETLGGKPASAFMLTSEPANQAQGAASVPGAAGAAGSQNGVSSRRTTDNSEVSPGNSPLATACKGVTADGTATANQVAKFTAPCQIHQSLIFDNGTNVGVRTTSPAATVDINAPNQVGLFVRGPESGVGAGLDLLTTGAGGLQWEILDTGIKSAQGANKLNIRNVNTARDVLTITSSGNVGVETVNPAAGLDVEEPNGNAIQGQALATSGTTFGVLGLNASTGSDSAAVLGNAFAKSGTTYGVKGVNSSSGQFAAGVEGENFATSGETLGMVGFAESPNGTGTFAFASGESKTAFGLLGCCAVGVWGDSGVGGLFGTSGVVGSADDGKGGTFLNNSPSGFPTAYLFNSTSNHKSPVMEAAGNFGSCTTDTDGNLTCTGTKSAVVPLENGQRQVALYAVEAPQNWFEDFGSGQLASGAAVVTMDPTYAQTVDLAADYHVFLTPEGDCQGLYVSHKTAVGFEVHELGGGHSNVAFAYRIVALRRGYENVRLEDMTQRLKNIKPPQPKPTPGPLLALPPPPRG